VEDTYNIRIPDEQARLFSEILVAERFSPNAEIFAPADGSSTTIYSFHDASRALDAMVTGLTKNQPVGARLLAEMINASFESYGITDPKLFLESSHTRFVTVQFDTEGEKRVLVAGVADEGKMKKSLSRDVDFSKESSKMHGEDMWQSKDGSIAFVRQMGFVLIGDPNGIQTCVDAAYGPVENQFEKLHQLGYGDWPIHTFAIDSLTSTNIAGVLSETNGNASSRAHSFTRTRFNRSGMERKTTSDFGFIGWIIAQLADN
jgi:hypothetical protein